MIVVIWSMLDLVSPVLDATVDPEKRVNRKVTELDVRRR